MNVTAFSNLGFGQRMAGRYDAAIASFRTVLGLSPNRVNARSELGNALMLKGDPTAALAEALAVFECRREASHPGGDHVILLGRVLRFAFRPSGEPLVFFRGAYGTFSAPG